MLDSMVERWMKYPGSVYTKHVMMSASQAHPNWSLVKTEIKSLQSIADSSFEIK